METIQVNGKEYEIIELLGKGKGGYSYLCKRNNQEVVVKQIHHEPCAYYQFGDKIQAEMNDYQKLLSCKISIPKMIDVDVEHERIVKEYVDGPTIENLVKQEKMKDIYYQQIEEMANKVKQKNINIDFYPTNFVVQNDKLFYIDFECNTYDEKWNYDNWGKQYWLVKD